MSISFDLPVKKTDCLCVGALRPPTDSERTAMFAFAFVAAIVAAVIYLGQDVVVQEVEMEIVGAW